jgi:DNA-binding beta-propeller fold protein YncE
MRWIYVLPCALAAILGTARAGETSSPAGIPVGRFVIRVAPEGTAEVTKESTDLDLKAEDISWDATAETLTMRLAFRVVGEAILYNPRVRIESLQPRSARILAPSPLSDEGTFRFPFDLARRRYRAGHTGRDTEAGASVVFAFRDVGGTPLALSFQVESYPVLARVFGSFGGAPGEFRSPDGVAILGDGSIVVVDRGNERVQVVSSEGRPIRAFGATGSGRGEFSAPTDVAVDSKDQIYVVDTGNRRIQKFDAAGRYLAEWGGLGTGPGRFTSPAGIGIDRRDRVYVADGSSNIQVFDPAGKALAKWGKFGRGDGLLSCPDDVAVDSRDNIYVIDSTNHRVQKFAPDHSFLAAWGRYGTSEEEFNHPVGIDTDGRLIYAVDMSNHCIHVYDAEGKKTYVWGSNGPNLGQLHYPWRIAVDRARSLAVVTVPDESRIYVYRLPSCRPTPIGTKGEKK